MGSALDLESKGCIRNILNTYHLNQIIDSPTRITPHSSTYFTVLEIYRQRVIDPFCSDHCAIHFTTNFLKTTQHTFKRKVWQYDKGNYDFYREKLDNADWNFDNLTVDEQANKVTQNILDAAEPSVPNKVVTVRPKDQPWLHNDIRKAMRKRTRLHKLAKDTNQPQHWANFRMARYHVTNLIRDSKLNYFKKLAQNLQQGNISDKNWWKIAKNSLVLIRMMQSLLSIGTIFTTVLPMKRQTY